MTSILEVAYVYMIVAHYSIYCAFQPKVWVHLYMASFDH